MTSNPVTALIEFLGALRSSRLEEAQAARDNPFMASALQTEKLEGHRIAIWARTAALLAIALLLPFQISGVAVLYYEASLAVFIAIGWLQLRYARVGQSRAELALIFADLAFMTLVIVVPSPLFQDSVPTAMQYRFANFSYFFVLLAVGTLAYSWRTVLIIGVWITVLWLGALAAVVYLGRYEPGLTVAIDAALAGRPFLRTMMDPNDPQILIRAQEVIVLMIVAAILALKGWRSNLLLMRQAEIAAERANLSRYFPRTLVDELASTRHDVGAVRSQEVAVLFADIVGFTEMAEKLPPDAVIKLLRRYYGILSEVIFAHGGTLDKYLGDGVMATFGTPHAGPSDATNALAASRQILIEMERWNTELRAAGQPDIHVSIGVHFGPAIIGDIGSERRLEFATLGDTVNVASRLEGATRELGCRLVVSDAVATRAANGKNKSVLEGFRPVSALSLRGRNAPIDVWIA